jgi:hypothetical protein
VLLSELFEIVPDTRNKPDPTGVDDKANPMTGPSQPTPKRRPVAGSASWLALVAATSLGIAHAETVRAAIRLPREAVTAGGRYRLIVQAYDGLRATQDIPSSVRPRASAQRAVTLDDLADGVRIDLISLGEKNPIAAEKGVVVAWVEPGEANLEFDARRARPTADSFYGVASSGRADSDPVEILLNRRRG